MTLQAHPSAVFIYSPPGSPFLESPSPSHSPKMMFGESEGGLSLSMGGVAGNSQGVLTSNETECSSESPCSSEFERPRLTISLPESPPEICVECPLRIRAPSLPASESSASPENGPGSLGTPPPSPYVEEPNSQAVRTEESLRRKEALASALSQYSANKVVHSSTSLE